MEPSAGPNAALIGQPGSRWQLATPALILDVDLLDANIERMAAFCEVNNIALRPHAKSHKSVEIAGRQVAAGAVGICCATIGEAEVLAGGGVANVLVTSPVAGDVKIARLSALNNIASGLMAVCENSNSVFALNAATSGTNAVMKLVVDLDIGQHRTGVTTVADALDLAREIDAASHLEFAGIQAYGGHLQHMADISLRTVAAAEASQMLRQVITALDAADLSPVIVTGAGTGTFEIDTNLGLYTELQAGSYIFMDVEYADEALWPDGDQPFDTALFVQTTVVSTNHAGQATTDAGLKAFATDGPLPLIARGAPEGASYKFTGDEFGCVTLPAGGELAAGSVVECMVPHCDPTVNLYDFYHCVRGDTLVDIWPVDARGKY